MFTHPKNSSPEDTEMIDLIAETITLTNDEVNDWHLVDQVFTEDWERPLVRILRFFVDPSSKRAPAQDVESGLDVVVDLVSADVLDLTSSLPLSEELAS